MDCPESLKKIQYKSQKIHSITPLAAGGITPSKKEKAIASLREAMGLRKEINDGRQERPAFLITNCFRILLVGQLLTVRSCYSMRLSLSRRNRASTTRRIHVPDSIPPAVASSGPEQSPRLSEADGVQA
jgi:hypothetical protein